MPTTGHSQTFNMFIVFVFKWRRTENLHSQGYVEANGTIKHLRCYLQMKIALESILFWFAVSVGKPTENNSRPSNGDATHTLGTCALKDTSVK